MWLDTNKHLKGAHQYNSEWQIFWKNHSNATEAEVLEEAKRIMKKVYGEDVL